MSTALRRFSKIINYIELGTGEPLLLIHGLCNNIRLWESQFELSNHYRLIIPELRGHGNSEMHNDLNVHTFAMDILELLDNLKIDTISACGISLGGVIAQELYTLQPKRIKSLILCHTMSYTPYLFRKLSISMGLKLFHNKTQEEIIESFVTQCLFDKKDDHIKATTKKAFYITQETFRDSSVSSVSQNYLPLLPFFNIPVLIISSLQDHIVPTLCSIQTHTLLPNSTLRLIKNAGHLSNIEQKNEFNSIIKDFLKLKKRRGISYSPSIVKPV